MPFAPMNILLEHTLPPKGTLTLPYPEGKNEGHFFGGVNHTLSIEGNFFRSPRDFTLLTQHDRILFTWNGSFALPAGALLNVQAEIPGGDFYFDTKLGITVLNMVHSPIFMVNLASPPAADERYWVEPTVINDTHPLKLARTQIAAARNVAIYCSGDNSHATFIIEGEDMYRRGMLEKITAPASGVADGKKAFAQVRRVTPTQPCNGNVSIGTGNKLGLPVFLPSRGYMLREIIDGEAVTGGIITAGETAVPTATTGDRRGTYSPPPGVTLNGKHTIHLLLSLLAPGNIGIPDYAG
jgi:hypothetical protein